MWEGEMDQLKVSISTMKGGYVGFRKAQLEPLLATLLEDPLLADVSKKKPNLEELETLIGVEKGSAMMLRIRKLDGTSFDVAVLNTASVRDLKAALQKKVDEMEEEQMDVAVLNTASVRDLKAALQKKVDEMEEEQMGHRHISWKQVWGNFCLVYNNEKLLSDSSLLSEFGIRNGDEICYENHLVPREAGRHSRAKKRRFFHGLGKSIK